jgi:3-oxoacyl-[acyl-carrier protein] reductase
VDQNLVGKRVLVTGGTRGIGRAAVLAFARSGARVVACHHSPGDAADTLAAELKTISGEHLVIQADVTDRTSVRQLADTCSAHLGGLDVLVNNVGVDGHRPFGAIDDAEWHRVMNHNLTSAYLVTQAVLGQLADGGSIVNVGASVALRGRPNSVHYTTSKAALVGFGRALCKELGPRGIRVNTVAPGMTVSGQEGPGVPPPVAEQILRSIALGRFGTVDDVAGAVLFLAGDTSRFISGVTIEVDGGV